MDRRFVERGEVCYWSVCITYLTSPAIPSPAKPTLAVNKRGQIDYREILPPDQFALFSKLRSLRKMIAEAEGTPLYAIVSNEQMAEMVAKRITTLTGLAEINGIGDAKLEKYGKRFLEVLQVELPASSSNPGKANETPAHPVG